MTELLFILMIWAWIEQRRDPWHTDHPCYICRLNGEPSVMCRRRGNEWIHRETGGERSSLLDRKLMEMGLPGPHTHKALAYMPGVLDLDTPAPEPSAWLLESALETPDDLTDDDVLEVEEPASDEPPLDLRRISQTERFERRASRRVETPIGGGREG